MFEAGSTILCLSCGMLTWHDCLWINVGGEMFYAKDFGVNTDGSGVAPDLYKEGR